MRINYLVTVCFERMTNGAYAVGVGRSDDYGRSKDEVQAGFERYEDAERWVTRQLREKMREQKGAQKESK